MEGKQHLIPWSCSSVTTTKQPHCTTDPMDHREVDPWLTSPGFRNKSNMRLVTWNQGWLAIGATADRDIGLFLKWETWYGKLEIAVSGWFCMYIYINVYIQYVMYVSQYGCNMRLLDHCRERRNMSDENYVTIRPEHTNTHKERPLLRMASLGKKPYLWA